MSRHVNILLSPAVAVTAAAAVVARQRTTSSVLSTPRITHSADECCRSLSHSQARYHIVLLILSLSLFRQLSACVYVCVVGRGQTLLSDASRRRPCGGGRSSVSRTSICRFRLRRHSHHTCSTLQRPPPTTVRYNGSMWRLLLMLLHVAASSGLRPRPAAQCPLTALLTTADHCRRRRRRCCSCCYFWPTLINARLFSCCATSMTTSPWKRASSSWRGYLLSDDLSAGYRL